jgi:bla regulator protein BlaR1
LATAAVAALAVTVIAGMAAAAAGAQATTTQAPAVQSPAEPQWQIAAGGKMAFDVASVKPNKSDDRGMSGNIPLTLGPNFATPIGNLFSVTNAPLRTLFGFAYKLSVGQTHFLMAGLPSWVDEARFDINARAAIDNPTKDQFRLMVQSLLAERFKLATHHTTRQLPILELVPSKPGKTGPQLTHHVDDATCGAVGRPDAPPEPGDLAAFPCGMIMIGPAPSSVPGRARGGGRNVSMDYIAAFLNGTGLQGVSSDRLIVNRTGLDGEYDFWMEFAPQFAGPAQTGQAAIPPDPNGPTFLEALQDQLGLKLKSTMGPVDVLVIDHVEEPSEN